MAHRLGLALLCIACAAAPPVYFQGKARTWSMPLVGPLENGELVVPVLLDGQGPFLFGIDADTPASLIDWQVAESLDYYRQPGYVRLLGADGHSQPMRVYEIRSAQAGDLSLRNFQALGVPPGSLWFNGRQVAGVLGMNIFSSTIVMDIDRDGGTLGLALTGHQTPPPQARPIEGRVSYRALFVPARVEGQEIELRLHMGARFCALWPRIAERLGVPFGKNVEKVRQLTATVPIVFGPRAIQVELAPGAAAQVAFTSLYDQMTSQIRLDGVLGQNYLARFRVVIDRDDGRVWLAPREPDLGRRAAARIGRWGAAFGSCTVPGCVELVPMPAEGAEPPRLLVRRSPGITVDRFEAVLEAIDAAGKPLTAPLVRVAFEAGARDVTVSGPRFAAILGHAAAFRVIELSPFPGQCIGGTCVEAFDRTPR